MHSHKPNPINTAIHIVHEEHDGDAKYLRQVLNLLQKKDLLRGVSVHFSSCLTGNTPENTEHQKNQE